VIAKLGSHQKTAVSRAKQRVELLRAHVAASLRVGYLQPRDG